MNTLRNCMLAAAVFSIITVITITAGCRARNKTIFDPRNPAAESILPDAIVHTGATAMSRPYFAAGLALLVLGGLAAIAGARTMGPAAMALGTAVTAVGVVIARYPWAILLAFLAALGVAAAALLDRRRKQRELAKNETALAAAAQVIQNTPEGKAIKQGLADLGADIAAQVREVVTPIKDRLRLEGKI